MEGGIEELNSKRLQLIEIIAAKLVLMQLTLRMLPHPSYLTLQPPSRLLVALFSIDGVQRVHCRYKGHARLDLELGRGGFRNLALI